ncbi:MAG: nucleotide exchange factor GrpE [Saprospiraceae bacterium]
MEKNEDKIIDNEPLTPEELSDDMGITPEEINSELDAIDDITANTTKEIKELKDKYLRLLAEFENYKKRTSRERVELFKMAGQELIVSLLPVLDDFDRAFKHGQSTEGSQLIHNKIVQILKLKGLQEMKSTGELFDVNMHEAITELPVSEGQKNKIIDTVEKGYYLSDKIIRHAKVVIGK